MQLNVVALAKAFFLDVPEKDSVFIGHGEDGTDVVWNGTVYRGHTSFVIEIEIPLVQN